MIHHTRFFGAVLMLSSTIGPDPQAVLHKAIIPNRWHHGRRPGRLLKRHIGRFDEVSQFNVQEPVAATWCQLRRENMVLLGKMNSFGEPRDVGICKRIGVMIDSLKFIDFRVAQV